MILNLSGENELIMSKKPFQSAKLELYKGGALQVSVTYPQTDTADSGTAYYPKTGKVILEFALGVKGKSRTYDFKNKGAFHMGLNDIGKCILFMYDDTKGLKDNIKKGNDDIKKLTIFHDSSKSAGNKNGQSKTFYMYRQDNCLYMTLYMNKTKQNYFMKIEPWEEVIILEVFKKAVSTVLGL
jgi:hypothetical protein